MSPHFTLTSMVASALLLAAGAAQAAWPTDPAVNLPVCTATGEQSLPAIIPNGLGGSYVLWRDYRSGTVRDLYCQRLDAEGTAMWTANGRLIESGTTHVEQFEAVPDGAGGLFVACQYAGTVCVEHVPFDPTRPTLPGQRATLVNATGEHLVLASSDAGEVTVAWYEQHSPVDSLRVDRWRPDPAHSGSWLRTYRAARSTHPIVRLHVADDGRGGAWLAAVTVEASPDFRFQVRIFHWTGTSFSVNDLNLPWTGESYRIEDYSEQLLATPDGGLIVVWDGSAETELHPSFDSDDVFATRLDPQMTQTALAVVANGAGSLVQPRTCPDGEGGAIVSWIDETAREMRARHVSALGTPGWPEAGVLLSASDNVTVGSAPGLVPTTDGGAFAAWKVPALRARRVGATGWAAWNGPAFISLTSAGTPDMIPDGADGAFVVWQDKRNEAAGDIYMQRLRGHGQMNAAATITSVADLPGDQGGRVRITWDSSSLDRAPEDQAQLGGELLGISAYGIWRLLDAGTAARAIAAGARLLPAAPRAEDARPGVLRRTGPLAAATYWEGVGMVLARSQSVYSFVATTLADSTPGTIPWETFMVDAHERDRPVIWDSAPDSGYSVDNLSPPTPSNLSGAYDAGTTSLHWNPVPAADLVLYRLYRGMSIDFATDAEHRFAETADTSCVDSPGSPHFYKVTGLDVHGNEGPAATFDPGIPVGTGGPSPPRALRLAPPAPNPTPGPARLDFSLPREARVELAVHDLHGRRVRVLAAGMLIAGEHSRHWDGLDEGGRAAGPGLYLVHLRVEGSSQSRKLVRMR